MAYPANEGGIGGKFRRRPSARTPSKPYDRPPTALRGVRGSAQVTGERGGWMSKLLDPASRFIANGASKLFASMFRKRLTAPPLEPGSSDKDLHPAAEVPQHPSTNSLSATTNGETHNGGSSVDNQKNSSDCGIVELEQLLKQKTFTMVECTHLEELLRTRTVENSNANHENSYDKKGKSVVVASDVVPGSSKIHKKFPSNGLASRNQTLMIEARSPAEVAKAYMGSSPSKDSSLSGSLRDQVFDEETNFKSMASAPRCFDLSVAPRSVIRFSGIPEQHQYQNHAYQTTKPVGRSAMYRMSRSPYFKVNRAASTQVGEISRDDRSSPVSSQWKSRGKQALKRGITDLDDEYGSFGPIRRIRQKSNLLSPSRINKNTTSVQKSVYLEGRKQGSPSSETAEGGTEKNSVMHPVQSSEKAHKLFQQLDKLLPSSPKEKPSELKAMTIDESPSKLTLDMLHGSALKSMKDIRSSNFLSTQEFGKASIASSEQNAVNAPSKSKIMDEESSLPQNHAYYGMDLKAPQANGVSKTILPSKNVTKPAPLTQKKSASSSVSIPISKRPAFRISAPEDSFDLDDDEDDNTNHLSIPSTSTPPDSVTKISAQNGSFSKTGAENSISGSMFSRKDEKKDAIHPVLSKKENEFTFPIASGTCTQSQLPPTPTMPTPQLNTQDPRKETVQNPIPSSGSKDVKPSTDDAGIKVGEEFRSEATLTTSSSTSTNSANESTMVKSEALKTGDVLKSTTAAFETSTTSTSTLFSFGTSSTSSLCNGSLNPSPNTDSVPSNSFFGNNNPTNSISNISSVSSAAATFSTTTATPLFQQSDTPKSNDTEANTFKASSFSMPASTSQDTSSVLPTSSPSMSNCTTTSTSPATSSAFSSTPSSVFGFSASTQSIGSSVFGATNGSTTTSTLSASSSQNSKPIVSGATENSSQNSTAVTFGANSTVTFGADNNNSSQNSSMTTFGASGTTSQKPDAIAFGFGATDTNPQKPSAITFGAENNSSQNSKITTFGATDNKPATVSFGSANGSIFGTQSTQTVTESAQASQSSTSQFGLFSSSPSFGLSNSSSGSFGNSPFGSTSSNPNPFTSNIFGSSSQASSASPIFTSNSSSSTNTSASAPVFGSSTSSSSPFQFGSSNSGSGFTFGSSALGSTSTPTPFTFNSSSTSSTSPFTFNSSSTSSTSPFTFNSSSTKPSFAFGANSPNNDQMSVEDSMTDAANQPLTPAFPTFGQPQNTTTTTTPGFMFGSPAPPQQNAVPSFSFGGVQNPPAQQNALPSFSFGGVQNPPAQQNASPFQPGGGVDFNPGGSFSLGSGGGGDKSTRKIIKVKRGLRGRK